MSEYREFDSFHNAMYHKASKCLDWVLKTDDTFFWANLPHRTFDDYKPTVGDTKSRYDKNRWGCSYAEYAKEFTYCMPEAFLRQTGGTK